MTQMSKLTTKEYEDHTCNNRTTLNDPLIDQHGYQRLIGKLLYRTMTRLAIDYRKHTLS